MDDDIPSKSVIGDDGELTKADSAVDLSNYAPYETPAWGESSEPAPISAPWYERWPVGLVVVIGVFLVGMVIWINNNSAPGNTLSTASNAGGVPGPFQLPAPGASTISAKNRWENIQHVKWSSDSSNLGIVTAKSRLFIWDFDQNQLITKESISGQGVDWLPNNTDFVTGLHGRLDIRDGLTTKPVRSLAQSQIVTTMSVLEFSDDGSQVAVSYGKDLWIIDAETGHLNLMRIYKQPVYDVIWSPRGNWVYFTVGRTLNIWAQHHDDSLWTPSQTWVTVDISPDGGKLVAGYDSLVDDQPQTMLAILDITTGTPIKSIQIPSADTTIPMKVAWSPDGSHIASYIEGESSITLWDSKTLQAIGELYNKDNEAITSLDWSPDGHYLAFSSSSYVTIWNSLPAS